MGTRRVDLNADLAESFGRWRLGDDEAMLALVSSANLACGFHAGDPVTLVDACRRAVERGVVIGAQVGYRDLAGFGRRFIDVAPDELYADVLYQLSALDGLARTSGGEVRYLKPHGALYHATVDHQEQATAVVRAVTDFPAELTVLGLPGSQLLAQAEAAGLRVAREVFADRGYRADGTLVSRREPGALIEDADQISERIGRLVEEGALVAVDGTLVEVEFDSICVHGDSPGAVRHAETVRNALAAAGASIAAFADA